MHTEETYVFLRDIPLCIGRAGITVMFYAILRYVVLGRDNLRTCSKKWNVISTSHLLSEFQVSEQITCIDS